MPVSQEKILLIFIKRASFIEKDKAILSNRYQVDEWQFDTRRKIMLPWIFLKQLLFLIVRLPSYKAVVSEFGGYHTFLPGLFGKLYRIPHVIICCGSDCVAYPSLNYGNLRKGLLKWVIGKSYAWADLLCPVHEKLMGYENSYYSDDIQNQGILNFFPDLKTAVFPVENGYDPEIWKPSGEKKLQFLTVAGQMEDPNRAKLKGVDLVEQLPIHFPEYDFILIGTTGSTKTVSDPPNLIRIPFVPHSEIIHYYQSSRFYLQLSISEGFPNALSEAMSSGCIPIVSDVSSMPQIVGESGFIVKKRKLEELIQTIKAAINSDFNSLSKAARERIMNYYPEVNRANKLVDAIDRVAKK